MVAEGHETGVFSATEQEYIKNIFDFTHTTVREVMVPRTRMVALNLELPVTELVETVLDNQYSRYPGLPGRHRGYCRVRPRQGSARHGW